MMVSFLRLILNQELLHILEAITTRMRLKFHETCTSKFSSRIISLIASLNCSLNLKFRYNYETYADAGRV